MPPPTAVIIPKSTAASALCPKANVFCAPVIANIDKPAASKSITGRLSSFTRGYKPIVITAATIEVKR